MTPSETTNATTANLRRVRAALYLTTAAAAVAIPGIGQANTTSTVAAPLTTITVDATPVTPDTVAVVNAATGASPIVDAVAFKRPHDPPHLHTFALLI